MWVKPLWDRHPRLGLDSSNKIVFYEVCHMVERSSRKGAKVHLSLSAFFKYSLILGGLMISEKNWGS